MKKSISAILILFSLASASDIPNNAKYQFPIKEPVYIGKKILITGWYDYKRKDYGGKNYGGLNIVAREGSEVYACESGVVETTGYGRNSGIYITILQNDNIKMQYCHLSDWAVKRNDQIKRGGIIGYVGRTGRTSGSHLRLVAYDQGKKKFITWLFGIEKGSFEFRGSEATDYHFDYL